MAINFPDPNVTTEYTYVTDDGVSIEYVWDGEKWNSLTSSGGGSSGTTDTSEVMLAKAINNPFVTLPDLETLQTQENYNEYVYTAVENIYTDWSGIPDLPLLETVP